MEYHKVNSEIIHRLIVKMLVSGLIEETIVEVSKSFIGYVRSPSPQQNKKEITSPKLILSIPFSESIKIRMLLDYEREVRNHLINYVEFDKRNII